MTEGHGLEALLQANKEWANRKVSNDPGFFSRLSHQQEPDYLWIGCSDSRVPANEILGLDPGEVFVHRNIANVVVHSDLNCLSVIQYAVEVLQVQHIIVCGHYGCGGVGAADGDDSLGLIDNWLMHIKDIRSKHLAELEGMAPLERQMRLCELNVIEQVEHVATTTIVRSAWANGQNLTVHGLVYSLEDGLLRDLHVRRSG